MRMEIDGGVRGFRQKNPHYFHLSPRSLSSSSASSAMGFKLSVEATAGRSRWPGGGVSSTGVSGFRGEVDSAPSSASPPPHH
ncbi:hypothetical protein JOQ06_027179, partial [Pogonophryne albipinna]